MTLSRRTLSTSLAGLVALFAVASAGAWWWDRDDADAPSGQAVALGWEDLVPADFEPAPDPFMTMSDERLQKLMDGSPESEAELAEIEEAMSFAPVDETLDGKLVTLPGYVVPLDYDGQTRMSEFLLVPYFGACIHTPPPPANQIVMAELERAVEITDTWEPVQLRGVLRTDSASTVLADTGYTMDVLSVDPFEVP